MSLGSGLIPHIPANAIVKRQSDSIQEQSHQIEESIQEQYHMPLKHVAINYHDIHWCISQVHLQC
jgi:hypothetical protein